MLHVRGNMEGLQKHVCKTSYINLYANNSKMRVSNTTWHVRYAAVVVLVLVVLGGGIAVVWQTDDDQVKLLNPKSHSTTIPHLQNHW